MKIVGCDLHARQQTIAMVDTETGEFTTKTLSHEGNAVRAFYAALEGPVVVGIEATGAMQWFLELLGRAGNPMPGGTSGEDPSERNPEAEARSEGCRVDMGTAHGRPLSGDSDALDRTAGLANFAAGSAPVGEDASAIAAHLASDRTQSRLATRPRALECSGAKRTAGTASAALHRSETDRTTEVVRRVAETNPGTGSRSGSPGRTKAAGAPTANPSGSGTSDGLGQRGVSRRPESLCHWQTVGQLHRDDSV